MRKTASVLLGLVVLSCIAPLVNAGGFPWPDWASATRYLDATGDSVPFEDMTICYATNSYDMLFFRAEFLGPGVRDLFIYLDTVPLQGRTGTDEGHTLHDIGADYMIWYGSAPVFLYSWNGTTWQFVEPLMFDSGADYVQLAVNLASIGNPAFPINLLFISTLPTDATDWNPDTGHLTYPLRPVVGGVVYQSLAPWLLSLLGTTGILSVCTVTFLILGKRQG